MALAETANLAVKLSLKDGLTPGLKQVQASLGRFSTSAGKIGGLVKSGLTNAVANLAKFGALAAVGIGALVKTGLSDLATLESGITSVDGAIKQMGLSGRVTGAQIATWANEIEESIDAAFDDKDIVSSTTALIRMGKLVPENIRPAMAVMVDLAATMGGDVPGASKILAKALAAPEKAAGRLARVGVILTEAEQKQIKAMVKAGDTAGAQALLLSILAKTTGGAADAMNGPYADALNSLNDITEDARKALAEGFLPVIQKVANWLRTKLAEPGTMDAIRAFGQDLANGFDSLLSIAQQLPWGTIGASLQLAGAGAKAVLGAFTSLPPWVQTAVITGWGLNKLTGGALGGIVGELGKGLIKGVLSMNAAVVNINAATVNGGGGLPGGKGGKGGGGLGGLVKGAGVAGGLATAGVVGGVAAAGAAAFLGILAASNALVGSDGKNNREMAPINTPYGGQVTGPTAGIVRLFTPALARVEAEQQRTTAAVNAAKNAELANERGEGAKHRAALAGIKAKEQESLVAFRAGERATQGVNAKLNTANARLAAIRAKKTQFTSRTTVNVTTSVSVSTLQKHTRYRERVVRSGGGLVAG